MKQIVASVFFDILSYTIGNTIFLIIPVTRRVKRQKEAFPTTSYAATDS